jgi:chromosome segregation ATPase
MVCPELIGNYGSNMYLKMLSYNAYIYALFNCYREFTDKLDNIKMENDKIKEVALNDLREKLDKQKADEMKQIREEEKQINAEKLSHQKALYEQNIKVLHTHISEHKSKIQQLLHEIESLTHQRERVITELMDTRSSYQQFINRVRPFQPQQSEYVMPPLRSVTII